MGTDIAANIAAVKQRIAAAAERGQRSPDSVKLLAVTKTVPVPVIEEAIRAGITALGENYVQEAREKIAIIGRSIPWHMIGHLQTNKAKYAVTLFDYVHSVDRLDLAAEIDTRAGRAGRQINILIEINVSGEKTKNGIPAGKAVALLQDLSAMQHIAVKGLMTMAPYSDDPETSRPYFRELKNLQQNIIRAGITGIHMEELSMGMTDDFDVAVEEGATLVRIGRAIFGERN